MVRGIVKKGTPGCGQRGLNKEYCGIRLNQEASLLIRHPSRSVQIYIDTVMIQALVIKEIPKWEVDAFNNKINIWQPQVLVCAEI